MSDTAAAHEAPTSTGIEHKKLIMWLFLASDCMFFGTLISTHLLYRKLFPAGFTDAEGHQRFIQNLFNIELTSFSTFILLMSSFLMALAVFVMYVILAILYESYVHPLTVLSTLPTALVGGLATLYAFGEPATLYAFVGMFMLMGIVGPWVGESAARRFAVRPG